MGIPVIKGTKYHGNADLRPSRYFAMYLAQVGWIVLGVYLLQAAYWPSSCRPDGVVEVFTCSIRLPESRNWTETALATWLWSTPLLIMLDISRRYRTWVARRAK